MANRVCVSCGLSTDSSGRLIVNTGLAVWPYACAETNGVKLRCGNDGVLRSAMPEKYGLMKRVATAAKTGMLNAIVAADGVAHNVGVPAAMSVVNPSACLPMQLMVTVGIYHAQLIKTGAGRTYVLIQNHIAVTGAIVDANSDGGHQIYELNGTTAGRFDSSGALNRRQYVLPAGGTATFTLTDNMALFAYNGNSEITNWNSTCIVEGFSLGTGQAGFTG